MTGVQTCALPILAALQTNAVFSEAAESSATKGFGKKLAISGQRYASNSFLLDGADINDAAGGSGSAAGTIAGTMAGDRLGARTAGAGRPAQNCRTVESSREVIKGYNVVYRFNGRDVTTTMPYDPGNTVRVGFSVIEDGAPAAEREPRRDRMSSNTRDNGPAPANSTSSYRY